MRRAPPGGVSALHAHHAIHLLLGLDRQIAVQTARGAAPVRASGVLTAPDQPHAIDATGAEILIVFLDPESEAGRSPLPLFTDGVRLFSTAERDRLEPEADPLRIMGPEGAGWVLRMVEALGGPPAAPRPPIHPRVHKLLRLLRTLPAESELSLPALAEQVGMSAGRLMHVFTPSIGIPLRPYLAWLRAQRAVAAISSGWPLGQPAHAARFADAAHMTRTFRRMFGVAPSELRPSPPGSDPARSVRPPPARPGRNLPRTRSGETSPAARR